MNILLFSMPDSFEHMPAIAIRMPRFASTDSRVSSGFPTMRPPTRSATPTRCGGSTFPASEVSPPFEFARRHVDWPYIQHPTPYPGTPMAKEFRARGLIEHERLEEYDGTTAVVRSEHLAADEIEFLRWRADRWLKLRHLPAALAHDPWFVLRHAPRMLAHTFRGRTLRTWLGLEDERRAFARYRAIRRAERSYL